MAVRWWVRRAAFGVMLVIAAGGAMYVYTLPRVGLQAAIVSAVAAAVFALYLWWSLGR